MAPTILNPVLDVLVKIVRYDIYNYHKAVTIKETI